jgi:hypothetical protein
MGSRVDSLCHGVGSLNREAVKETVYIGGGSVFSSILCQYVVAMSWSKARGESRLDM